MDKQNIVVLGSTGSIGINTLKVIDRFKDRFRLIGICAGSNTEVLRAQAAKFKPEFVAVYDESAAEKLKSQIKNVKLLIGIEGICRMASLSSVHTVVISITGSIALLPLLEAIKANKKIALANKESLVVGGHIVNEELRKNPRARIIPIDSEQNAIFQCLKGYERSMVNSVYLTASGGPLVDYNKQSLRRVSPEQALSHPRWKMGRKITIDSATLMNKGLEVIEAKWLFNMPLDKIKVIIHKEAIVHSLVEFIDGSVLGQLAVTDMKLPIQYALSFPERWSNNGQLKLDFTKMNSLSFRQPDLDKFPCLELAYYAASRNNMLPCVLNAANEEAVEAFLDHCIAFTKIPYVIEKLLNKHKNIGNSNKIKDLMELDRITRIQTRELIGTIRKR